MTFYKVNDRFFTVRAAAFQYALKICERTILQKLRLQRLDKKSITYEHRWSYDQDVIHYFYDNAGEGEYISIGIYRKEIFNKQEIVKIFQRADTGKEDV